MVMCVVKRLWSTSLEVSNIWVTTFLCCGNYRNDFLRCLENPETSYNFSKATALRFAGQICWVKPWQAWGNISINLGKQFDNLTAWNSVSSSNSSYSPRAHLRAFNLPNGSAVLLVKSWTVTFRDCFLFACVCNLISCNNIVLSSHITTGVTLTSCLKKNLVVSCAWRLKDFQFGQVSVFILISSCYLKLNE